MSYQKSAQTRQAILDYLHANPLQCLKEIEAGIGATRNAVQSSLKYMTVRGEVARFGEKRGVFYRALVKKTISAEQVVAEMKIKKQSANAKVEVFIGGKKSAPGYYAQRGGNWESAKSAGGQGALRREFGIQSVMA